jgi:hypothetical protein
MTEEIKHPESDKSAPDGRVHPVVVPLDAPDSDGWWWVRAKDNPLSGDELCVKVSINDEGMVTIYWGRDWDYLARWQQFQFCDWVKAECPWRNAEL